MRYSFCLLVLTFILAFSCTKENTARITDISGFYSDTITIRRPNGTITDTVIIKEIFRINDSTYQMVKFLRLSSGGVCDSILLILKSNDSIRVQIPLRDDCVAYASMNPPYAFGRGFYNSVAKEIYLEHSILMPTYINLVVPVVPTMFNTQQGAERMKKL